MKDWVVVLILAISTLGPAIVIAAVGFASIMALGRNPSSAPKIMLAMITAMIFAMGIALVALIVVHQVFTP